MSSKNIDDDNQLVRTAKVRSAISFAAAKATQPMSATEFWVALETQMVDIGTNKAAFTKVIENMAKNGQITRVNRGRWVLYADGNVAKTLQVDAEQAPQKLSKNVIDLENVTIADARKIYAMLHKMFGKP